MRRRRAFTAAPVGLGLVLGAAVAAVALGLLGSDDPVEPSASGGEAAATQQAKARPRVRAAGRGFKPRRPRLQKKASFRKLKPRPVGKQSRGDRGAIWDRGCMLLPSDKRSKPCIFGKRKSRRSVVLFGDSHAMHLFAAVNRLAKRRGWRLIALTRAGCPPFDTPLYNPKVKGVYRQCQKWQRQSLRRIGRVQPRIVFTSGAVVVKPMRNGKILRSGGERRRLLKEGYERMLERIVETTDGRVIALKDLPQAPHDMTDCVAANLKRLRRCSFRKRPNYSSSFESRAAASVAGVSEVNISPGICPKRRCFGVIRNRLVYRDDDHLTATFARTLAPWLARGLKRARRRAR